MPSTHQTNYESAGSLRSCRQISARCSVHASMDAPQSEFLGFVIYIRKVPAVFVDNFALDWIDDDPACTTVPVFPTAMFGIQKLVGQIADLILEFLGNGESLRFDIEPFDGALVTRPAVIDGQLCDTKLVQPGDNGLLERRDVLRSVFAIERGFFFFSHSVGSFLRDYSWPPGIRLRHAGLGRPPTVLPPQLASSSAVNFRSVKPKPAH